MATPKTRKRLFSCPAAPLPPNIGAYSQSDERNLVSDMGFYGLWTQSWARGMQAFATCLAELIEVGKEPTFHVNQLGWAVELEFPDTKQCDQMVADALAQANQKLQYFAGVNDWRITDSGVVPQHILSSAGYLGQPMNNAQNLGGFVGQEMNGVEHGAQNLGVYAVPGFVRQQAQNIGVYAVPGFVRQQAQNLGGYAAPGFLGQPMNGVEHGAQNLGGFAPAGGYHHFPEAASGHDERSQSLTLADETTEYLGAQRQEAEFMAEQREGAVAKSRARNGALAGTADRKKAALLVEAEAAQAKAAQVVRFAVPKNTYFTLPAPTPSANSTLAFQMPRLPPPYPPQTSHNNDGTTRSFRGLGSQGGRMPAAKSLAAAEERSSMGVTPTKLELMGGNVNQALAFNAYSIPVESMHSAPSKKKATANKKSTTAARGGVTKSKATPKSTPRKKAPKKTAATGAVTPAKNAAKGKAASGSGVGVSKGGKKGSAKGAVPTEAVAKAPKKKAATSFKVPATAEGLERDSAFNAAFREDGYDADDADDVDAEYELEFPEDQQGEQAQAAEDRDASSAEDKFVGQDTTMQSLFGSSPIQGAFGPDSNNTIMKNGLDAANAARAGANYQLGTANHMHGTAATGFQALHGEDVFETAHLANGHGFAHSPMQNGGATSNEDLDMILAGYRSAPQAGNTAAPFDSFNPTTTGAAAASTGNAHIFALMPADHTSMDLTATGRILSDGQAWDAVGSPVDAHDALLGPDAFLAAGEQQGSFGGEGVGAGAGELDFEAQLAADLETELAKEN